MLNRWLSLFVTLDNVCIISYGETQTRLENRCVLSVCEPFLLLGGASANCNDNIINIVDDELYEKKET